MVFLSHQNNHFLMKQFPAVWTHAGLFILLLSGREGKKSQAFSAQVTLALPLLCTLYMCLSTFGEKVGTCWSWPSYSLAVTSEKAGLVWSRHIFCFWTSFIRPQEDLDWFVWEGRIVVGEPPSVSLWRHSDVLAEDEFCAPGGLLTNPPIWFPFRAPAALNLPTTLRECQCFMLNFHLDSSVSRQRSL